MNSPVASVESVPSGESVASAKPDVSVASLVGEVGALAAVRPSDKKHLLRSFVGHPTPDVAQGKDDTLSSPSERHQLGGMPGLAPSSAGRKESRMATQEARDRAVALYIGGATVGSAAKAVGVDKSSVSRWLRQAGVAARRVGGAKQSSLSEQIAQLREAAWSLVRLIDGVDRSVALIYGRLSAAGSVAVIPGGGTASDDELAAARRSGVSWRALASMSGLPVSTVRSRVYRMGPLVTTGQGLSEWRDVRQLSRRSLADALRVTKGQVRDWERGYAEPPGCLSEMVYVLDRALSRVDDLRKAHGGFRTPQAG
jgi:transposase-like protein